MEETAYPKKDYIEREVLEYRDVNIVLLPMPIKLRQEAIHLAKKRIDEQFTWPLFLDICPYNITGLYPHIERWRDFEKNEEIKKQYDIYKIPMDDKTVSIAIEKGENRPKFTKSILKEVKDLWYESVSVEYDERLKCLCFGW